MTDVFYTQTLTREVCCTEHGRVEHRYPKASTTEKLRLAKNRVMRRMGKRAMK